MDPVDESTGSESHEVCVTFVPLLCRLIDAPLSPMRVPPSLPSLRVDIFLTGMRCTVVGISLEPSNCLKVLPPGAGKESMSATSDNKLVCRSSKLTAERKSKDPEGGVGLRWGGCAVDAMPSRPSLLTDVCRVCEVGYP